MSLSISSQLKPVTRLSTSEQFEMCALLQQHFEGVCSDIFTADLRQKNWALLLRERDSGALKGFTTMQLYQVRYRGQVCRILYSGDTIMAPSAWASAELPRAWIQAVQRLHQPHAPMPLFWLLISSGFRTYRLLPTFWREFYPRYDRETPPAVCQMMNWLGRNRFSHGYDADRGIVRLAHPQQLRQSLRRVPEARLRNPHVRFFLDRNPGHGGGDELLCLTEIRESNLTKAGCRLWKATSLLEKV